MSDLKFPVNFALFKLKFYLVLDKNAFERLLGSVLDIMKRQIDDYEDQVQLLIFKNSKC